MWLIIEIVLVLTMVIVIGRDYQRDDKFSLTVHSILLGFFINLLVLDIANTVLHVSGS